MKKDHKYMADIERAVADKYGKQTVQDFRSQWDPDKETAYLEQAKKLRFKKAAQRGDKERFELGDIRITKKRNVAVANRRCPVCKTYSFSSRDDLYMNRFSCCHMCYEDFVYGLEDEWKSDWRPDGQQVADALRRRNKCQIL